MFLPLPRTLITLFTRRRTVRFGSIQGLSLIFQLIGMVMALACEPARA